MNNIKLSGTIGKDPIMRYTADGKAVLSFRMSLYTGGSKDEGYKPSVWVGVSAWSELAEDMNNQLKQGSRVTVTGRVNQSRTYQKDGEEKDAGLEVTANDIELGDTFREVASEEVPF